jgi:uncharacterized membrane protein YgcG
MVPKLSDVVVTHCDDGNLSAKVMCMFCNQLRQINADGGRTSLSLTNYKTHIKNHHIINKTTLRKLPSESQKTLRTYLKTPNGSNVEKADESSASSSANGGKSGDGSGDISGDGSGGGNEIVKN